MGYSEKIANLVSYLNICRDEYYNNNNSIITDEQYDKLFDELVRMESESGIVLTNSPTQTVGYEVKSDLKKVEHTYPLLSLDKTKLYEDVVKFCGDKNVLFMYKVDGLTCQLTYVDGEFVRAETRGDGFIGEDITHNALTFIGIPKHIPFNGTIKITGEAVINRKDFLVVNERLGNIYKNPRNLASGSVRQLNSSICATRMVRFIVWNANDLSENNSMFDGLMKASNCGFTIVHSTNILKNKNKDEIEKIFNNIKDHTRLDYIPIDGIVIMYDDINFGNSLGRTSHHFRNGLAFKFYGDTHETTLNNIEFTIGKTGVLTPTAVFDPVDIDGTTITRASVHNISILRDLNLCKDDDIEVYKANEIIPQIKCNNTKHVNPEECMLLVPKVCPYCASNTKIVKSSDSLVENLYCTNKFCNGVLLKKLSSFVSKQGFDIDGLSEKTLEKFIELGYIKTYIDIFTNIYKHKYEISKLPGFGDKSVQSLIDSIEKSKEITLDKVFVAFNIEGIGKQNAVDLAKFFNNDKDKVINSHILTSNQYNNLYQSLIKLDGFGDVLCKSICNWFSSSEFIDMCDVLRLVTIKTKDCEKTNKLSGMSFVITGKLNIFSNRESLIKEIEDNGGIIQSSVTSKTTYLINNDVSSKSSKNNKAKELNIPIIGEDNILKMLGDSSKNKHLIKRKGLF